MTMMSETSIYTTNAEHSPWRAILTKFAVFTLAFFALYALTAQRGLGWGDSGEFQFWVLKRTEILPALSFSNSHPLYICFARLVASTPFHVTLVSSLFGALAVGGFYLCSRNAPLTALFGLSHMLWRMSCLAEVQTMNLAFTAFVTLFILQYLKSGNNRWFVAAAFLSGLQLTVHNFALLQLPAMAVIFLIQLKNAKFGLWLLQAFAVAAAWAIGAAYWLYAIFTRGVADVLVGKYADKVMGIFPQDMKLTIFNLALSMMSFLIPSMIVWWNRRELKWKNDTIAWRCVIGLFAVNSFFFIRYFVPDQATFLLPTLFFAFLLLKDVKLPSTRMIPLVIMQILLPLIAYQIASQLPLEQNRTKHPYRNEAKYFAYPWKFNDDSADRCAELTSIEWNGYIPSITNTPLRK